MTRLALALLVASACAAASAADGPFARAKGQPDPARVRALAAILRTDPDEKACQAAVAELGSADPRANPDVMPALLAALRRDAAAVRAAAADAIGRFRAVFPSAGQALEAAAESDPSPAVRSAAQKSLWEYHLNGYRSPRGGDGLAASTAEPPLARPRPPVVVTAGVSAPVVVPTPPTGPRLALLPGRHGTRTVFALDPPRPQPAPRPAAEPLLAPRGLAPVPIGLPPPLVLELPSIVPHPGVIPGTTPFPAPTAEPPLRKGVR